MLVYGLPARLHRFLPGRPTTQPGRGVGLALSVGCAIAPSGEGRKEGQCILDPKGQIIKAAYREFTGFAFLDLDLKSCC